MKYLISLSSLFFTLNISAQTPEDSVKSTIINLFTAMKNSDSAIIMSSFSPNAVLQTITRKNENVIVKDEKIAVFAGSVAKTPKGDLDERISFEIIRIDADLAIAWTPYSFYYKGKFSHCGVNSFQLVRINNEWKIQYLIDTRRKLNCIPD